MVPIKSRRHSKHCVVAAMTCNCTIRGSVLRNGLLVYTTRHAKLTLGFTPSFLPQRWVTLNLGFNLSAYETSLAMWKDCFYWLHDLSHKNMKRKSKKEKRGGKEFATLKTDQHRDNLDAGPQQHTVRSSTFCYKFTQQYPQQPNTFCGEYPVSHINKTWTLRDIVGLRPRLAESRT